MCCARPDRRRSGCRSSRRRPSRCSSARSGARTSRDTRRRSAPCFSEPVDVRRRRVADDLPAVVVLHHDGKNRSGPLRWPNRRRRADRFALEIGVAGVVGCAGRSSDGDARGEECSGASHKSRLRTDRHATSVARCTRARHTQRANSARELRAPVCPPERIASDAEFAAPRSRAQLLSARVDPGFDLCDVGSRQLLTGWHLPRVHGAVEAGARRAAGRDPVSACTSKAWLAASAEATPELEGTAPPAPLRVSSAGLTAGWSHSGARRRTA